MVKLALFEENRLKKLAYMARGGWDALRGRGGIYAKNVSSQHTDIIAG
jgi:hypothetical protein